MFSVCSAAPSCSHHQISFPGGLQPYTLPKKDYESRCIFTSHLHELSFKPQAHKSFSSNFVGGKEGSVSFDFLNSQTGLANANHEMYVADSFGAVNVSSPVKSSELLYKGGSSLSPEVGVQDLTEQLNKEVNYATIMVDPETISTIDISPETLDSPPDFIDLDKTFSDTKTSFDDFFTGARESFGSSLEKGESALRNSLDLITSSVTSVKKTASKAVDDAVNRLLSSVDQTRGQTGNKLTGFSNDLKEVSSKATVVAIDLLRQAIGKVENTVANGASSIAYSYGSAKELLPPNIRSILVLSEDRVAKVLTPVGTVLQQLYIAFEGLERNIGVNPDDPIVHFVLYFGSSFTIWILYRLWIYGGYAGDLSPKAALELLNAKENSVLVDIRPEDLREKDGIPDLRRAARFRYASVSLPEVDAAVRTMLKGGRAVDDTLIAVVIKNLKSVKDRSKVIVMDAEGTRSKGVARALRRLGIKRPYLVLGGFKSWSKAGLRIKGLKPKTPLTVLNEEAEAILEDIRPSPLQVAGAGVGFVAAVYALLEWEKALQVIGLIGLGQTIYRRVASYEDSGDLKEDVRLLLAPVRLGVQAFSWAVGKIETNGLGLPTSPSSSDVQSRVLQAAAKHGSQPAESEGAQDSAPNSGVSPGNESIDLSEA